MFPFPFSFIGSGEVIPDLELISNDYAMEFDGTDEYVSAGNDSSLNITDNLSVSVWIHTSDNGLQTTVNKDQGSGTRVWNISMGAGTVSCIFRGATNGSASSSTNLADGAWHHIVATYEPSNAVKLYVDGALLVTDSTSIPASLTSAATVPVYIGAYSNYASEKYAGDIDEVAIWNKVLELEDVQTIYNSTNDNPGKCANLFTGGLGSGLVYWNRMGD